MFLRAAASGVPVWLVPQDRPTPGDILVRGSDRLSCNYIKVEYIDMVRQIVCYKRCCWRCLGVASVSQDGSLATGSIWQGKRVKNTVKYVLQKVLFFVFGSSKCKSSYW
jgi:hypothetical protein